MKLLLDQNISRKLVGLLQSTFPGTSHVAMLGLVRATDREIWDYASEHAFVIVSKDSDFRQMAFLYGPPPKSIWLNIGNSSSSIILELLNTNQSEIARFSENADEAFMMLSARSLQQ